METINIPLFFIKVLVMRSQERWPKLVFEMKKETKTDSGQNKSELLVFLKMSVFVLMYKY